MKLLTALNLGRLWNAGMSAFLAWLTTTAHLSPGWRGGASVAIGGIVANWMAMEHRTEQEATKAASQMTAPAAAAPMPTLEEVAKMMGLPIGPGGVPLPPTGLTPGAAATTPSGAATTA